MQGNLARPVWGWGPGETPGPTPLANVGATPQKYRESGDRRMSLGYVGKYVAGTAIGDGRIIEDKDGKIKFRAFDYRTRESIELTMGEREFVDAFSQHILPLRLRRFRMVGIFAPQGRETRLAACRKLLGELTDEQLELGFDETNRTILWTRKKTKAPTCRVRSVTCGCNFASWSMQTSSARCWKWRP